MLELYLDDLVLNGKQENVRRRSQWEALGNHVEFTERIIRPYHDFGFSDTGTLAARRAKSAASYFATSSRPIMAPTSGGCRSTTN